MLAQSSLCQCQRLAKASRSRAYYLLQEPLLGCPKVERRTAVTCRVGRTGGEEQFGGWLWWRNGEIMILSGAACSRPGRHPPPGEQYGGRRSAFSFAARPHTGAPDSGASRARQRAPQSIMISAHKLRACCRRWSEQSERAPAPSLPDAGGRQARHLLMSSLWEDSHSHDLGLAKWWSPRRAN